MRPFHVILFCCHTNQVFCCCSKLTLLDGSDTLVEDVRQALHAFCRRLAILHFEVSIIVRLVCLQFVLNCYQVHIGLGKITFEGHEWTMVRGDFHQNVGLLSWSDDDVRIGHSLNTHRYFAGQPKGNLRLQGAIIGKGELLVEAFQRT